MRGIRMEFWYGYAEEQGGSISQSELYVSGPAAAAGHVLDALNSKTNSDGYPLRDIKITPDAEIPARLIPSWTNP